MEPHRVLLVEDDPAIRVLVGDILADEALTVREAHSLAEGRAVLAEETPDVVLLDLVLPDGEGMDLLDVIPRTVQVIAMTGSERLIKEPGRVLSYLPKPFEPQTLRLLVRQALRGRFRGG